MTTARQEVKEIVRNAFCSERERAVFYRRLEGHTDNEIDQKVFPQLAAIYTRRENAAPALRAALFGAGP